MVILERRKRKGPILTPSSLPCLGSMPTINITEGCAHDCVYCYAQGYSTFPGAGRVMLGENIHQLVADELRRKRKLPRRVFFSTSSDAFQPVPEVLEVTYQTMSALLECKIEVAFLTKGAIDERFLDLFSRSPGRVFAQIGITTLDDHLWRVFEPGAASPARRLKNIERLAEIGVAAKARLDPLLPGLTDTHESLSSLLTELRRRQVRGIAASYLFLRPAFAGRVFEQLRQVTAEACSVRAWPRHRCADGVGSGQMIDLAERQQRFQRIGALAAEQGIDMYVCTCMNPDLNSGGNCQIAGPPLCAVPAVDSPLFAFTDK